MSVVWSWDSALFFCMWILSCPGTICWKVYILSPIDFGTLVKNNLTINKRIYFWTFSSILMILYLFLYQNHSVSLLSLSSKFWNKCDSSDFVVFQSCFGFMGRLHFQMNFKISSLISAKKITGTLIGIVPNL